MARILIGAGGTGGHVYPALAVAEALRKSASEGHNLTFVGTRGGGGLERRLVEQSDVPFDAYEEVYAGPLVGVNILRVVSSLIMIGVGVVQSFLILMRRRPQVILLTGGWANVPLALAAWLWRVPMLVYLPDIEPGRTIQILGKIVSRVAVTVPEATQFFREGQTVVTGYPLRVGVLSASKETAVAHFGLDPNRKTILVTGGSRGARTINIAVLDIWNELLDYPVQMLHVIGYHDWERAMLQQKDNGITDDDTTLGEQRYQSYQYLDSQEMGLALAAADIIIGRSGASALGEFPYFGAASILVPYPYAWRYQKTNADWLVKNGAGIRINDEDMATLLLPTLKQLLSDDDKLKAMQDCARSLYSGNGAENLAHELRMMAGE